MPLWWKNNRDKDSGGLRLTEAGFDVLTEIDLQHTTYHIQEMSLIYPSYYHLDKFIDCPYYLTNRSIIVTNEKKAVELTLFSGDLRKYG